MRCQHELASDVASTNRRVCASRLSPPPSTTIGGPDLPRAGRAGGRGSHPFRMPEPKTSASGSLSLNAWPAAFGSMSPSSVSGRAEGDQLGHAAGEERLQRRRNGQRDQPAPALAAAPCRQQRRARVVERAADADDRAECALVAARSARGSNGAHDARRRAAAAQSPARTLVQVAQPLHPRQDLSLAIVEPLLDVEREHERCRRPCECRRRSATA